MTMHARQQNHKKKPFETQHSLSFWGLGIGNRAGIVHAEQAGLAQTNPSKKTGAVRKSDSGAQGNPSPRGLSLPVPLPGDMGQAKTVAVRGRTRV